MLPLETMLTHPLHASAPAAGQLRLPFKPVMPRHCFLLECGGAALQSHSQGCNATAASAFAPSQCGVVLPPSVAVKNPMLQAGLEGWCRSQHWRCPPDIAQPASKPAARPQPPGQQPAEYVIHGSAGHMQLPACSTTQVQQDSSRQTGTIDNASKLEVKSLKRRNREPLDQQPGTPAAVFMAVGLVWSDSKPLEPNATASTNLVLEADLLLRNCSLGW